VAAASAAVAIGADSPPPTNQVGKDTRLQPSGRLLAPPGKLTTLGNHPGGGALTRNGRFLWTLSAGRGRNDIRIVEVAPPIQCPTKPRTKRGKKKAKRCRARRAKRVGRLVQTIPMPGLNGGIAMSRDNRTAYVSGTPETTHKDQESPAGTPGKEGDVIHVFRYDGKTGMAARAGTIPVPPPSGVPAPQALPEQGQFPVGPPIPQSFPPTNTSPQSWPRDLAVSGDGKTLLAALNLADRAAVIDLDTKAVRYVRTGSYPYGAAIARDGRGLVSNESDGTVSVIDLKSAEKVKDIKVGAHLTHPEGIAVDPTADRAFVAVAGEDRIAVIDTKSMTLDRQLNLRRPEGIGTMPTQLTVDHYGCYLMSADSGEDAIALFRLRSPCRLGKRSHRKGVGRKTIPGRELAAPPLIGRVPTASYPVMAGATPHRKELVWIAAKGFGIGPNPNGPSPLSPKDSDDEINSFGYLPSIVTGTSGVLPFPKKTKQLKAYSAQAARQLRPTNVQSAPPGSPIVPPGPGGGKIQHVFYVVRENRTYDQVLGDDPRGDGDPKLELFPANITPNAHALAKRFPLLDHVFANSEASIDGHFWTSAAGVTDYVTKNWHQNYGGRGRPYDFGVYAVTWPSTGFMFDQAERQDIPYFNYGEAIAGTVPLTDKDRTPAENQQVQRKFANSDLGAPVGCFPNDAYVGKNGISMQEAYDSSPPPGAPPTAESRFDCFKQRFALQEAQGKVPALNYIVLPNDHTQGVSPGRRTPRAMVAENDYALGQVVDLVSHSSVWDTSMILVIEDDSQDGADHLDAHRIPAFAISPYAKPGAVVHTRYDFPSVIRTLEIPLGMNPMTLADALGVPMYDAFDSSRTNAAPYSVIPPKIDIDARNANTAANRRAMAGVEVGKLDSVPQRKLDQILWRAIKGWSSTPPPPGPNASGKDEAEEEAEEEAEAAGD
jgi:DNA-binding beta-propeller fold protein YncE